MSDLADRIRAEAEQSSGHRQAVLEGWCTVSGGQAQPAQSDAARDDLVSMTLAELTDRWRPGSHDTADGPEGPNLAWTWADEAHDLFTRTPDYQARIVDRVHREGIDYGNAYGSHILLGNDGRVWDGHHRIVAGLALGIEKATVDVACSIGPAATEDGQ